MLESHEQPNPETEKTVAPAAATDAPALLVIDDDTVHRMIICKVAQRAGFAAAGAASYEQAVAMLEANSYALITLDLSLGERGGVEVLHYVSANDCATPIIIISGSGETVRSETMNLAHLLSISVCEALPKPVDLAQLRRLLLDIKDRIAVGLPVCGRSGL